MAKFLFAAIFALIWNPIVFYLLWNAIKNISKMNNSWFYVVFLIPFALAGVVAIISAIKFLMQSFNPRPKLTISSDAVPLGGVFELDWTISGRTNIIERLRITLVGKEEVKYQGNKNIQIEQKVFVEIPIVDTKNFSEVAAGRMAIVIPTDAMHSFEAENNKFIWSLNLNGEIKHWPDIKEEFPITVLPVEEETR